MQNVQPAFVNQFGQPCDSMGNPLLAAQPQQQVVYVQAAGGGVVQMPMQMPAQAVQVQLPAQAQGQVVYAQSPPPAYSALPPQYAPANTTIAVGAQQGVVYAPPQGGGAAAAAGAGAQAAAQAHAQAQVSAKGAATAAQFTNGRVVVLMSVASGKSLRMVDLQGHMEGRGAKGEFAQFKVHTVGGGSAGVPHVKLESIKFPGKYIRIDEKENLNGNGTGGGLTEFAVIGHDNGTVSLQSVHHAKAGKQLHVGVLQNGDCKPPNATGQGPNGRYTPHFIK